MYSANRKKFTITRSAQDIGQWYMEISIGILALGYCMYVYLCSILCFLPYVTIQGDWGRIIGTLAYTNAAGQYGYMFVIPTGIMEMYSAPNGVLLSFVLLFASCFFIHEIRQYIWAYWEKL